MGGGGGAMPSMEVWVVASMVISIVIVVGVLEAAVLLVGGSDAR